MKEREFEFVLKVGKTTFKVSGTSDGGKPPKSGLVWIENLLNGEFKQTIAYLTTISQNGKEGDCCLGVAEKICPIQTPFIIETIAHSRRKCRTYQYDLGADAYTGHTLSETSGELTPTTQKWLRVRTKIGVFEPVSIEVKNEDDSTVKTYRDLTVMNDRKIPFPVIAEVIRRCPAGLFVRSERKTTRKSK